MKKFVISYPQMVVCMYSRAHAHLNPRQPPITQLTMIANKQDQDRYKYMHRVMMSTEKKPAQYGQLLSRSTVRLVRSLIWIIILLHRTIPARSPAIKRIRIHLPGRLCMTEKTILQLIRLIRPIPAVPA